MSTPVPPTAAATSPVPPVTAGDAAPLLRLADVHTYHGHVHALKGVSLEVFAGEIVTLIGANGAGKSTLLRSISGQNRARQGEIQFQGRPLNHLPPHAIAALGIGHVPEGRRVFPKLTVEENLDIGGYLEPDPAVIRQRKAQVFAQFPKLAERRKQDGGTLSGGEQQMLAIGRALMQEPRLLLLDEPTMGLAPVLVDTIFEIITDLNTRQGRTILLVEQNAWHALKIARRAYVLSTGQITMHGLAAELADNPAVRKSYLSG